MKTKFGIITWLILSVILSGLIFVSYLPSLSGTFIGDDENFIVKNPHIRSLKNIPTYFWDLTTISDCKSWGTIYRPLRTISFALDYHFWGLDPGGYHVTNVLWHILNSLLVLALIWKLTGQIELALPTSLIFGLHPVHTEVVAWISSRGDLLFLFFFLSSFILFLHSIEIQEKQFLKSMIFYVLSLTAFVLGLFSKEMIVSLPLVLALWLFLTDQPRTWQKKVVFMAPFFVILTLYLQLKFVVLQNITQYGYPGGSYWITVWSMLSVVWRYLTLLIMPDPLCFHYFWLPKITNPLDYQVIFGVLIVLGFLYSWWKTWQTGEQKLTFFLLWFWISIFPVSNLIVPINTLMAERFLYLPSIGIIVVFLILVLKVKHCLPRGTLTIGLGATVIVLGVMTFKRTVLWMEPARLYAETVTNYPRSILGRIGLATSYYDQQNYEQAEILLIPLVKWYPKGYEPLYALGLVEIALKKYDQAEKLLEQALIKAPHDERIITALGSIYAQRKQYDTAIEFYRRALAEFPGYYPAWNNLGRAFLEKGQTDLAHLCFEKAYHINPLSLEVIVNYALHNLEKQSLEKVASILGRAKKTWGINPTITFLYGDLSYRRGDFKKALLYWKEAMAQGFDDPLLLYNLGTVYLKLDHAAISSRYFDTLNRLFPDYPKSKNNWAVALISSGRYVEARILLETYLIAHPYDHHARANLELVVAQIQSKHVSDE
ncbi:tetratricopeptide repeat protein [candidate division CSSED10-310 bacterium]|uniref:Tetratricopeptide repeat protein n=1 Tax=candidate division CSSED10-310 bacterium TaxID=2855610 RepID=A0ABV6YWL9_UNCC1